MSRPSALRRALRWSVLAIAVAVAPALALAHENTIVHRGLAHWSVDILGNPFFTSIYRAEVGNGAEQEDVPATRSLGHFYNPQTNSAPWFALGSGPATDNSRDQYDAALSAYIANNLVGTDAAFHRMGRALHFVEDMTSPPHTHDDDHATGDDFESWGPDNFPAMDFSTVIPKYANPPTPEGFVREVAQIVYDQTVYQALLYESSAAQPSSVFKQMFPSLHFVDGGFFVDNHFEVDRIGDWGCDLLCTDDWWVPDELLITDNGGPGGVTRHTGSAYIENSGGDGGPVVPVVFAGQPNTTNQSLMQLYASRMYPEAIAYGAGLLQVFADQVGAPLPTATGTVTATPTITLTPTITSTPLATATATNTPIDTVTATPSRTATQSATVTLTNTPPPTPTPTWTFTATRTVTATPTRTATLTATPTLSATPTISPSPSSTPTHTPTPLCAATPRAGCAAPAVAAKSKLQLRNSAFDSSDSLTWRWSGGDAQAIQFGIPSISTNYALCFYDRSGAAPTLVLNATVPGGTTCFGGPCWKSTSRGFKYKSSNASPDGVTSIVLKEGLNGRAKLLVKAKGDKLVLPAPVSATKLFAQDPALTVQLVNSLGFCWDATYSAPAQRNQPDLFNDKSD